MEDVVKVCCRAPISVVSEVSGFFTSFHERLFLLLWMAKRARERL
jgi:hypothetical protein